MNDKLTLNTIVIGIRIRQQIAHDHIYRIKNNKQQKYRYTLSPYTLQTWESKLWQKLAWGILPKLSLWAEKAWDEYRWGPDIPTTATHDNTWGKHNNAVIKWNLLTDTEKKQYCEQANKQGHITGQNLFRRKYTIAPYETMITWHIWRWSGLFWG